MPAAFEPFCIEVPATSANLGPGFDSFGLALMLYNRFAISPSQQFSVTIKGYTDPELEHPESNMVFSIYRQVCRNHNLTPLPFTLTNTNQIPLYGGIGSSASAIVAGIVIANRIHAANWDAHAILNIAFGFEKHLDNIAAAIFGGFVTTSFHPQLCPEPLVIRKKIESSICAWMLVPHLRVTTSASRIAMPSSVGYKDAVFNLAHAAQVALAFEREDWNLLAQCMLDKLHQPYREDACAGLLDVTKPMHQAGAYAMCLSGSGPSVLVFCDSVTDAMRTLVDQHMRNRNIAYTQLELAIDNTGVHYS